MRKYRTEGCLNMWCISPFFVQHHNLDQQDVLDLDEKHSFHIYMICRRKRITFDPKSISYQPGKMTANFMVLDRNGPITVPFTTGISIPPPLRKIKCEYPFNQVEIVDENEELVLGFNVGHMMAMSLQDLHDPSQAEHLDLEVLYVGQAYGENGERKAPARLKNHETLLQIYSELSASAPDDEIWIALLHFEEPFLALLFDGAAELTEMSDEEDDRHLEEMLANTISERQQICFAEAALIRYFQPKYNNTFKYNFPNPSHASYAQCYEVDLHSVSVELQFEGHGLKVYSSAVPKRHIHIASFPLHSPEVRKKMFEFDDLNFP